MNSIVSAASLASAAAIPSPAIAAEEVDPIFEALEQHKRAAAMLSDALGRNAWAEKDWKAKHGHFQPCLVSFDRAGWEQVTITSWPFDEDIVRITRGAHLNSLYRGLNKPEALAECRKELADIKRRHRAVFKPLEIEISRCQDLLSEAEQALAGALPQTLAGAIALLRYIREDQFARESLTSDDDFMHSALVSIEMLMCEHAGLEVPPSLAELFEPEECEAA